MKFILILFLSIFILYVEGQNTEAPSYSCDQLDTTVVFTASEQNHSARNSENCSLQRCQLSPNNYSTCYSSSTACFRYLLPDNSQFCAPGVLCSILEPCDSIMHTCSSIHSICAINSCCSPQAVCLPWSLANFCMLNVTTTAEITTTSTTTATKTTITTTSTTTDIPCSPNCTSQQTCVKGVCVGIGYLSITLTWSRAGDGDIVVATPNNKIIYYQNKGPSSNTDQGQLDVDDRTRTGPENVFWTRSSSVPPTGLYNTCFSQYSFTIAANSTYPITATIKISHGTNTTLTFQKMFTSNNINYSACNSNSTTFMGSFTYP